MTLTLIQHNAPDTEFAIDENGRFAVRRVDDELLDKIQDEMQAPGYNLCVLYQNPRTRPEGLDVYFGVYLKKDGGFGWVYISIGYTPREVSDGLLRGHYSRHSAKQIAVYKPWLLYETHRVVFEI